MPGAGQDDLVLHRRQAVLAAFLQAAGQVAVAVRLERPLPLHALEQPHRLRRLLQVQQAIADQPQGVAAAGMLLDDARQHPHGSVGIAGRTRAAALRPDRSRRCGGRRRGRSGSLRRHVALVEQGAGDRPAGSSKSLVARAGPAVSGRGRRSDRRAA